MRNAEGDAGLFGARRRASIRAPIARSVVNSPARVGLSPMFGTSTSDPGTTIPAQTGKAAEEGSPGMAKTRR